LTSPPRSFSWISSQTPFSKSGIEKTLTRERKHLVKEFKSCRGNGMELLCPNQPLDGIRQPLGRTIMILHNVNINPLRRRLAGI
jgi:hypothetical protein